MMCLYLIEREGGAGYDEAKGFVIAAKDETQARGFIQPGDEGAAEWDKAPCKCIGAASRGLKAGVVLKDFRAG